MLGDKLFSKEKDVFPVSLFFLTFSFLLVFHNLFYLPLCIVLISINYVPGDFRKLLFAFNGERGKKKKEIPGLLCHLPYKSKEFWGLSNIDFLIS